MAYDAHERHEDIEWSKYYIAQGKERVYQEFYQHTLLIAKVPTNYRSNLENAQKLAQSHVERLQKMVQSNAYRDIRDFRFEGELSAMQDIVRRQRELLFPTPEELKEEEEG